MYLCLSSLIVLMLIGFPDAAMVLLLHLRTSSLTALQHVVNHQRHRPHEGSRAFSVAIVGAGPGGSASAFWISKASERLNMDVLIEIYELSSYVGGRSFAIALDDSTPYPFYAEMGAYLLGETHHNLLRACDEFQLPLAPAETDVPIIHFWNGQKLSRLSGSTWDLLDFIATYGLPEQAFGFGFDHASEAVRGFEAAHKQDSLIWESPTEVVERFGLTELFNSSALDYLVGHGASGPAIEDVLAPSLYGPFGHESNATHALQGAFTLSFNAPDFFVQGGTNQIFQEFVTRSRGTLFLNTPVESITRAAGSHGWYVGANGTTKHHDAVILAAPFDQVTARAVLPHALSQHIPPMSHKAVYVTIVVTPIPFINHTFLGFPSDPEGVRYIISSKAGRLSQAVFDVLRYERQMADGNWVVKIVSQAPVGDDWVFQVFYGQVDQLYRHKWDVPQLVPTTALPPFKLDGGFYYLSGFERVVSSMETQVVAARNVVNILLRDHFGVGICGTSHMAAGDTGDADQGQRIDGWDC